MASVDAVALQASMGPELEAELEAELVELDFDVQVLQKFTTVWHV